MGPVAHLAVDAVAAGVAPGTDFSDPGVADATTTVVTAVTGYGVHRMQVPTLTETTAGDPDLTAVQRAARKRLTDFIQRVGRLPTSDRLPKPEPYRSDSRRRWPGRTPRPTKPWRAPPGAPMARACTA
ncbi:hypothetical protein [Actinoplanes sp. NPDC026623]|uniref:hypothetical protein n=1 Tax=Actinoplanes sp. NPDC026623 TaxID=3155610 RepID=UPI0034107B78